MTSAFGQSPSQDESALSASGRARREAMLGVLEASMAARVRRRRILRSGALAVLMVEVGLLIVVATPRGVPPGLGSPVTEAPGVAPRALTMRYASLRVVQTSPLIVGTNPASTGSRIVQIDDDRLLDELRAMGHPTGLIRTRGTVVLTADLGVTPAPEDGPPGNG